MNKNAQLLKLAGGCEHKWPDHPRMRFVEGKLLYSYTCSLCGYSQERENAKSFSLPEVGDGHRMNADELITMANWLWPGVQVNFWPEGKEWVCELIARKHGFTSRAKEHRPGRALGELILMLRKGEV